MFCLLERNTQNMAHSTKTWKTPQCSISDKFLCKNMLLSLAAPSRSQCLLSKQEGSVFSDWSNEVVLAAVTFLIKFALFPASWWHAGAVACSKARCLKITCSWASWLILCEAIVVQTKTNAENTRPNITSAAGLYDSTVGVCFCVICVLFVRQWLQA